MSTKYERFNEIVFPNYCKTCISHAVLRGRMEKAKAAGREVSIETLNDNVLFSFSVSSYELDSGDFDITIFEVKEFRIVVRDPDISRAVSFMTDKKRDALLLYYFMDMTDKEIGELLETSMHTIRYRRLATRTRYAVSSITLNLSSIGSAKCSIQMIVEIFIRT